MSDIEQAKKLFFEALSFIDSSDFQNAELRLRDALRFTPGSISILTNLAVVLLQQNKHTDAREYAEKAIAINAGDIESLLVLGDCFAKDDELTEALFYYKKCISLDQTITEAYNNCGIILAKLGRHTEALDHFDRAIALDAMFYNAQTNRGNSLRDLKRYDEAVAAYDKALALKPNLEDAWLGRGNLFTCLKRYDEASSAYDKALAIKPDLAEAWLGRGNVFFDLKRHDEGVAAYDKALAIRPDLAEAWLGRGNVFCELKRYDEAFAAYDKAMVLKPDLIGAEGNRLHIKMHLCEWSNLNSDCGHLIESVRDGNLNTTPFVFLTLPSSPQDRLQLARRWVANKIPAHKKPLWQGERYDHDRIRVAYLSADFREHPVSFLIAGMLEHHDKSRFETTAISWGPDDNSEIRARLKTSVERFVDVRTQDDDHVADLIKSLEVDVLVDLMGFTADSRTGIIAHRAAPVQVNYLGYAGTMGAKYVDYILADQIVIPQDQRESYSEKVVYLPDCFMPNDSKRAISERLPSRAECGLPETGIVFCSFNNNYKIVPQSFDIWMRILCRTDNSVLWLSRMNETAIRNLRHEARNRGVDPERIVFAQRVPLNKDHLARHRVADIFLDTLPYNAHTTATDALWAGLPVLTCMGEAFAGRVAASLLNAVQLPELIATTPEAYERMAIELATRPEKLADIKRKLAENRLNTPLFDTERYTKHLEAAYTAIYARHQAGLLPDHIVVSN